jgi:phenylacetate-coenzyme A ligase PaaK-like adenylate-forming protein
MIAEVVDETTGAVLSPGRTGTLALTLLDLDAPLLRYASGVSARLADGPCSCGGGGLVVELA